MADQTTLELVLDPALKLVSLLIALAFGWLIKQIHARMAVGMGRDAATELAEAARTVVLDQEQRWVSGLREKSRDGKLEAKDVADLRETSRQALKDQVSNQTLKFYTKNAESLAKVLDRAIEAQVLTLKEAKAITTSIRPPPP